VRAVSIDEPLRVFFFLCSHYLLSFVCSYGIVVYEVASGILPYSERKNLNEMALGMLILKGERPDLSLVCNQCWRGLIEGLLAHAPHDRTCLSECVDTLEELKAKFSRSPSAAAAAAPAQGVAPKRLHASPRTDHTRHVADSGGRSKSPSTRSNSQKNASGRSVGSTNSSFNNSQPLSAGSAASARSTATSSDAHASRSRTAAPREARALYNFTSDRSDTLALVAGDIITLTSYPDSSAWWEGELRGRRGYVPANYLALL
jgi:hypothetical protein